MCPLFGGSTIHVGVEERCLCISIFLLLDKVDSQCWFWPEIQLESPTFC